MPVAFYMDVHVPQAITDQLRRRGVDVLTAIEDGCAEYEDIELLERARTLGRVLFTQDIRFKALAEEWQRQSRSDTPGKGGGLMSWAASKAVPKV